MFVENREAYCVPNGKEVQIVLTVKLDPVPGAYDNPMDHVTHAFRNLYVQHAVIKENDNG